MSMPRSWICRSIIFTTRSLSFTNFATSTRFTSGCFGSLQLFLAHHALADGRHLRTMVGIDDGGDDVAAEGRTNLIEQVLVRPAALGIGMVAYDEARTVGREPAAQRGGDARSEVAPHRRRTEQGYLGFLLFEDTANHRRMGQGAVRERAPHRPPARAYRLRSVRQSYPSP